MRRIFFLLVMIFAVRGPAHADPLADGNAAYQSGEFQRAIQLYQKAISEGFDNGHVRFNLGNAYYRTGSIGRAIANYRLALLDLPGDPDVRANLFFARGKAVDRLGGSSTAWRPFFLNEHLSVYHLEMVFLVLYVIFWAAVLLGVRITHPFVITVIVLGSATGFSAFAVKPDAQRRPSLAPGGSTPAVVVANEIKVYSGNAENFQVVFLLHDGAEVMSGERRGEWIQLLLPDGRRGWVKQSEIQLIEEADA